MAASAQAATNPVSRENTLPGTKGWDLGRAPLRLIDGYSSSVGARPGSRLGFHVSAGPRSRYRIVVYRLGWYGGVGARRVACVPSCTRDRPGVRQPGPPAPDANGTVDARWSTTDRVPIGRNWVSGYYMAQFLITRGPGAGKAGRYPFVVTAPAARRSAILVQVPVNTWQAYNDWGGKSLYTFNSRGGVAATKVSFNRPLLDVNEPVFAWEYPVVRLLERSGYDVSYAADLDVDRDPAQLMRHRLVMSIGHDEYWTHAMRDGFDAARDAGRNLIFMGADVADWQVRYERGGRVLVGYKLVADPIADPQLKTTLFRNLSPPRPQCRLLGIQYQGGLEQSGVSKRGYTVAPTAAGDPWLAGTGLRPGMSLPETVGYEWDQVTPNCLSPAPTVLFHYDGPGPADAVRYTAPSGARVFSAGSLQFAWALDSYPYQSHGNLALPGVQRFMRNVLDDLTR